MSITDSPDSLQAGLVWEDRLPWRWIPLQTAPEDALLARVDAANEALLRTLTVMEETGRTPEEPAAETPAQELLRLERKLDILLDLVAELLRRDLELPEPQPLRLTAEGAELPRPVQAPAEGWGVLELFPSAHLPRALSLYATVVSDAPPGRLRVRFQGLGMGAREALERHIFRRHRRAVARARAASQDSAERA